MTRVFCGIGIADNHPATLRHRPEAPKSPNATVKGALGEFACKDLRNEAQGSACSPGVSDEAQGRFLVLSHTPSAMGSYKYGCCDLSGRLIQYNLRQCNLTVFVVGVCCS